jgi:hypothetical protein
MTFPRTKGERKVSRKAKGQEKEKKEKNLIEREQCLAVHFSEPGISVRAQGKKDEETKGIKSHDRTSRPTILFKKKKKKRREPSVFVYKRAKKHPNAHAD